MSLFRKLLLIKVDFALVDVVGATMTTPIPAEGFVHLPEKLELPQRNALNRGGGSTGAGKVIYDLPSSPKP